VDEVYPILTGCFDHGASEESGREEFDESEAN
jgi:hypothetical protein